MIKILNKRFLILFSELILPSPEKVKSVILKLNCLFEKTSIKKNKKYKPPIHWDEDLHSIKVGSRYLIFLKIENPVPVTPDIASKNELTNVTW